jgi:oligopeptide transport system substrate-binding protein
VLDEGTRYLFHLRDDWFWTDGRPVTARDFEWAWKRNLDPRTNSDTARFLYDVLGAQDYNQGISADARSVGVKALDAQTLEVRLVEPVAYFPFIITMPCTYPLPAGVVNTFTENWWHPGNIVSNGAYRLVAFDAQQGGIMERNPGYPGVVTGNVLRQEWKVMPEIAEMNNAYINNHADLAFINFKRDIPGNLPEEEIYPSQELGSYFLVFNPNIPPFDDRRVRKAVAMTFDRQRLNDQFNIPVSLGGLVPSGMPGHSPEIGLPFDVELARRLMDEAGYPGGQGFPEIIAISPMGRLDIFEEMTRQWRAYLGIDIVFEGIGPWELGDWQSSKKTSPLVINGWVADYPDPDNFLRRSVAITLLQYFGWQDEGFNQLIEEAVRTTNRARRMAMYRQADHLLIADQALLVVLSYNYGVVMVKPWVKHFSINLLGNTTYQNIMVEEH